MVANQTEETLPVGMPPAAVPVTVALSWTVEPIAAEVMAAAPAGARAGVDVGGGLGVQLVASRGSQGLTSVL